MVVTDLLEHPDLLELVELQEQAVVQELPEQVQLVEAQEHQVVKEQVEHLVSDLMVHPAQVEHQ